MSNIDHAVLLISCPDQRGITAAVTNFVFGHNGNIVHADQHIDDQTDTFFMRIEWDLAEFDLLPQDIAAEFQSLSDRFSMRWEISFTRQLPRLAVFVSKHLHCLQDVLWRHQTGQLPCTIPVIISNHPDAAGLAAQFGIDFQHVPISAENKPGQEGQELEILQRHEVDVLFLARYHQILTADFIRHFPQAILNIHHSFLPAFIGKDPYAQAYQKGVKIIGATCHYVTERLDEGPIIEQDTVRVSHRDTRADLVRKGQDLERIVSARALRWHLERRVLCYGNKTVVFD